MSYNANQWEQCFKRTSARIFQMRKRIAALDAGNVNVLPDGLEIGDETVTNRPMTAGERTAIRNAFIQIVNDLILDYQTGVAP